MDFYSIIKSINELKKDLAQMAFSAIEKDIIKSKIADVYLVLFEEQAVVLGNPMSMADIPPQKEPPSIDYKSLVDTFLEKEPTKQSPIEGQSLLSKISQTKIVDLKRSIAMNDRFTFIKELFKSDFDTYNRYINDLNGCENMEQAEQYLSQLKTQYKWDEENETVQYFLSLIGRKFL
jgi:hypothetical protein